MPSPETGDTIISEGYKDILSVDTKILANIISRDDVNKKLRNFNRNFLKNLPDSAVAALAGYDAMWTGNGDKEIVILKPGSAEIIELNEK